MPFGVSRWNSSSRLTIAEVREKSDLIQGGSSPSTARTSYNGLSKAPLGIETGSAAAPRMDRFSADGSADNLHRSMRISAGHLAQLHPNASGQTLTREIEE